MRRRNQEGESGLTLSFFDVLTCGLGVAVLLLVVIASTITANFGSDGRSVLLTGQKAADLRGAERSAITSAREVLIRLHVNAEWASSLKFNGEPYSTYSIEADSAIWSWRAKSLPTLQISITKPHKGRAILSANVIVGGTPRCRSVILTSELRPGTNVMQISPAAPDFIQAQQASPCAEGDHGL